MKKKSSSSLLNKSQYKKFVMHCAAVNRPGWKFSGVSAEFLQRAEAHLRQWTAQQMHCLPSLGKRIK